MPRDLAKETATQASNEPLCIWDASGNPEPADFWGNMDSSVQLWEANETPEDYIKKSAKAPTSHGPNASAAPTPPIQSVSTPPASHDASKTPATSVTAMSSALLPELARPRSIVMELSEPDDWPGWIAYIEGLARLSGIWEYADPNGFAILEQPTRPQVPQRPVFEDLARRESEAHFDYQQRLQLFKYKMEITIGEYNIAQDRHRIDCIEFGHKLEEYATIKTHLKKLNDTIFASMDNRWKCEMIGSKATTPREHLQKLQSLLGDPSKPIKADPVALLMKTAQDRGHCDWQSWARELRRLSQESLVHDPNASYNYDVMDAFLSTIHKDFEDFYDRWAPMVASGRSVDAGREKISVTFGGVLANFVKTCLQTPPFVVPFKKRLQKEGEVSIRPSVRERPPSPSPSAPLHEDKQSAKAATKMCPGCKQVHRIKGNCWWEYCWVYLDISGRKPAPKWYDMTPEKIERVKRRLRENPEEQRAADRLFSKAAPT